MTSTSSLSTAILASQSSLLTETQFYPKVSLLFDKDLNIFFEVWGTKKKLTNEISAIVKEYLNDQDRLFLSKIEPLFQKSLFPINHIDLASQEIFRSYLDPKNQKGECFNLAHQLLINRYEQSPIQVLGEESCGFIFTIQPEILAYAMKLAKNETILEIGGARGINAMLLAFAGAKEVFLNDIQPLEIQVFEGVKKQLPNKVSQKLVSIEASCFDILEKKPSLEKKIGLILCFNLIHFFTDREQTQFFNLVKRLLKTNGRAIFSVSASYVYSDHPSIRDNPKVTSFVFKHITAARENEEMPFTILHREITVCPENLVSSSFKRDLLYKRDKQSKWQKKTELNLQSEVLKKIAKKGIANPEAHCIQSSECTLRLYNEKTLADLLEKNGFEIEMLYAVGEDGHLVKEDDMASRAKQMGVVVKVAS